MARLARRGVYVAGRSLVCRKALSVAGRKYAPGAKFPGRHRLAISERKIRTLFDNGWLAYADDQKPEVEPVKPQVEPEEPEVEPDELEVE